VKRKFPLIILSIIFLSMAVFSGYQMVLIMSEYHAGEVVYDDAVQFMTINHDTNTDFENAPANEDDGILWPEVDFEALCNVNSEVVGWIYLEDSKINYPVVRGTDNSYYLNRLYDRSYNSSGSIFMDYRNSDDFSDIHNILYGHHMNNGTMFAGIAKYKDQAYYDGHPYCLLLTPEENYKVEFFAGYVASVVDDITAWDLTFESDSDFESWVAQTKTKSTFVSDVTPTADDKIITLSTCSYEFDNARYVLVGVLR